MYPLPCPALSQEGDIKSPGLAVCEAGYHLYCLLAPGTKPQWAAPQAPALREAAGIAETS